jgi:tripartite motif-containing protein 71
MLVRRNARNIVVGAAVGIALLGGLLATAPAGADEPTYELTAEWGKRGRGLPGEVEAARATAFAEAPSGDLYVADVVNDRVVQTTADGELVRTWDTGFDLSAQDGITGIVVGADGVVWVTDQDGDVVVSYQADGTPIDTIGAPGVGPGTLDGPRALGIGPDGDVFVLDSLGVQRFETDGSFVTGFLPTTSQGDPAIRAMAVAPTGAVFLIGPDGEIRRYSGLGAFEAGWTFTGGSSQANIDATATRVWVTIASGVRSFDHSGGTPTTFTTQSGSRDVLVRADGDVLVLIGGQPSTGTFPTPHLVYRYDPDGTAAAAWGSIGLGDPDVTRFSDAVDVAFAPDGSIPVLDSGEDRIQVFEADGDPLDVIGQSGSGPDDLTEATGLALDDDGNLMPDHVVPSRSPPRRRTSPSPTTTSSSSWAATAPCARCTSTGPRSGPSRWTRPTTSRGGRASKRARTTTSTSGPATSCST